MSGASREHTRSAFPGPTTGSPPDRKDSPTEGGAVAQESGRELRRPGPVPGISEGWASD